MNFSAVDCLGVLSATAVLAVTLVAPGVALARFFRLTEATAPCPLPIAAMVGLAVLPGLVSLTTRCCGLEAAAAVDLTLAIAGSWILLSRGSRPRIHASGGVLLAIWLAIVVVEWIDLDTGKALFQPLTDFDTVKHAATTQALLDTGAPPRDAFFFRPERSSYYYYFYAVAALAVRVSWGLVDARTAVGGMVFWTGIGVYGLIRFTLDRAGLRLATERPRAAILIVAVLALGGLDLVIVLQHAAKTGDWLADPLSWNEQAAGWFQDVLWVPHHVTALVAGTLGLAALAQAVERRAAGADKSGDGWRAIALAACAFAAMFGLSVWVTLGFVLTTAAWMIALGPIERRWSALVPILAAGGAALLLSAPQIHDLVVGRSPGAFPIVPTVRRFAPLDLWPAGPTLMTMRALALPLNFAIEFGALALGALAFWQGPRPAEGGTEFGRVLAIAAGAGLAGAAFLRSTLYNNDLGWRLTLLPLLAATVWTIAVLDRRINARGAAPQGVSPVFKAACVLGWALVLYTAVMMRAYPFLRIDGPVRFMAADPETQRALRAAYAWAGSNLPPGRVLQQNPVAADRSLAFGLYGRQPVGVSDGFGALYGADQASVDRRLAAVAPIFARNLGEADVARLAAANGIDAFVVTAADPIWRDKSSFVWRRAPLYASANLRIVPAATLEAAR